MVRMNYGGRVNDLGFDVGHRSLAPFTISPFWNDRGQPYLPVFDDGWVSKCQAPTGAGHHTVDRCVYIGYAAAWFAYVRPSFRPNNWHGSQRDATGSNFRRNRYYDAEKGRFTQEDPIELGGGLNLYGFANGDPVNARDPFGLCVKDDNNCLYLVADLQRQGGSEFRRAAATYDRLKIGRVYFIAKSQLGPLDQAADVRGLTAQVGHDSNVWLVGEESHADFLMTAVHEASHLRGVFDNTQQLVQLVYNAYMQLPPKERQTATFTGQWLFDMTNGQVGKNAKPGNEP